MENSILHHVCFILSFINGEYINYGPEINPVRKKKINHIFNLPNEINLSLHIISDISIFKIL